jgi:hypothetical protein
MTKTEAAESFPLQWPLGRERTPSYLRKPAPFKTTMGRARDELLHELKLLGAREVVISSNVATYRRGGQDIMYADQSAAKSDPGVAVYYTWKGEQYALACDRWNSVTDNLQALNKTVDAIRGIERWGTGEMMKAAFAGFKALPQQAHTAGRPWWEVLVVSKDASWWQIEESYKSLRKVRHPDAGGSHQSFIELQEAYEQAKVAGRQNGT